VWWDVWVGDEGCRDGRKGDEEVGAKVCPQTRYETCCCGEGDFLFDVEVKAVEGVVGDEVAEGGIISFELAIVSFCPVFSV
jgi:hypothetical protein